MNANGNVAVIDFWQYVRQQEADNILRMQTLLLALENQQAARIELFTLCDFAEPRPVATPNFSNVKPQRIPVAT